MRKKSKILAILILVTLTARIKADFNVFFMEDKHPYGYNGFVLIEDGILKFYEYNFVNGQSKFVREINYKAMGHDLGDNVTVHIHEYNFSVTVWGKGMVGFNLFQVQGFADYFPIEFGPPETDDDVFNNGNVYNYLHVPMLDHHIIWSSNPETKSTQIYWVKNLNEWHSFVDTTDNSDNNNYKSKGFWNIARNVKQIIAVQDTGYIIALPTE